MTTAESAIKQICEEAHLPAMDCAVTDGTRRFRISQFARDNAVEVPHRFLIASITKPVVAIAVLKLAAEGHMSLSSRVPDLLPGLRNKTYRGITVRHLLTHSSGLRESVAANLELRQQGAGIDDFMEAAESESLLFPVGTNCKYSSIGYMILGAIVESVSKQRLPDYLKQHLFEPLQMSSTSLGTTAGDPTVCVNALPVWQDDSSSWDWNSDYWKQFGAAWGGMFSTAEDLIRLAEIFLNDGRTSNGTEVLPPAVVRAMMANQTASLRCQPEFTGPVKDWSFGFRMQWPFHSASFGDFVSGHSVGHWGATGTVLWIDPASHNAACVLTTIPFEKSRIPIQKISNVLTTAKI